MDNKVRISLILVCFPKGLKNITDIFSVFSKFETLILGSLNIPDPDKGATVFGFVARANTDQLGAITGTLGKIPGVKITSSVLPE